MLNLIRIMKYIIYVGALLALLKYVVATFPNHDGPTNHKRNQDVLGAAKEDRKSTNATPFSKEMDMTGAQPFHAPISKIHSAIEVLGTVDTSSPYSDHAPAAKLDPYLSHKHTSSVGTSTSQWAITYTPYNDDLTCKSASSIKTDVASIASKGFTSIRLYATDCRALQYVGAAAANHGVKMIIGVHIDDPILGLAQPQIAEIAQWATGAGSWDTVEMVVIGNEAIFNEFTDAASLAAFITSARTSLRDAGYKGPITTTEPLAILSDHANVLCPVLDVAAANIHPFFHAEISAGDAGQYVFEQLDRLAEVCEGLEAVNLETGWPKRGRNNGFAIPSVLDQMVAITSIREQAGGRSVFLGFQDEEWKDGGEFDVETSWGCAYMFDEVKG
ncbi:hypothetical protein P7C71_g5763, partial [Lecanoromycetidae sp. Uapishka_2]